MKTTARFDRAVQKLYTAFHNGTLHPECCRQCAVGNILDNTDSWKHLSDEHGATQLNYIGRVHETLGRRFNGYKPSELLRIEHSFLKACGYQLPIRHYNQKPGKPNDKEVLFNGLTAVVKLLCELDGVNDVMDFSKVFTFEKTSEVLEV